jgi:hypothetical protein
LGRPGLQKKILHHITSQEIPKEKIQEAMIQLLMKIVFFVLADYSVLQKNLNFTQLLGRASKELINVAFTFGLCKVWHNSVQ